LSKKSGVTGNIQLANPDARRAAAWTAERYYARRIAAPPNEQKTKSRQTNPNHTRSKNNPGGRRNYPKTDWPRYNKGRRAEGQRYVRWMPRMAYTAREILGIAPGTRDGRVSAILVPTLARREPLLLGPDQAL